MPVIDVFAKVSDHLIDGIMMHEQMADYYNFLGLDGFKRLILNLEKRDTSYAVCERLAWLYIVRDHLKKPTVDATVMEQRITDELTGSEFLKAASNVDYAALMGVLDNHMSQIHALR